MISGLAAAGKWCRAKEGEEAATFVDRGQPMW